MTSDHGYGYLSIDQIDFQVRGTAPPAAAPDAGPRDAGPRDEGAAGCLVEEPPQLAEVVVPARESLVAFRRSSTEPASGELLLAAEAHSLPCVSGHSSDDNRARDFASAPAFGEVDDPSLELEGLSPGGQLRSMLHSFTREDI